jgi:hypothetical protein
MEKTALWRSVLGTALTVLIGAAATIADGQGLLRSAYPLPSLLCAGLVVSVCLAYPLVRPRLIAEVIRILTTWSFKKARTLLSLVPSVGGSLLGLGLGNAWASSVAWNRQYLLAAFGPSTAGKPHSISLSRYVIPEASWAGVIGVLLGNLAAYLWFRELLPQVLLRAQAIRGVLVSDPGDDRGHGTDPKPTTTVDESGRIITSATLEQLQRQLTGLTSFQASLLMEPYVGKWMRLKGNFSNISDGGGAKSYQVVFQSPQDFVYMYFEEGDSVDVLKVTQIGEPIEVLGEVVTITWAMAHFKNCELLRRGLNSGGIPVARLAVNRNPPV